MEKLLYLVGSNYFAFFAMGSTEETFFAGSTDSRQIGVGGQDPELAIGFRV